MARKSITVSGFHHSELKKRKKRIADILDVSERKVTYDDAVRTFIFPEDWNGLDAEEIEQRR